jgi:hypothetical protein
VLKEGDRVEIYRPLIADPKELRRQRAEKSVSSAFFGGCAYRGYDSKRYKKGAH